MHDTRGVSCGDGVAHLLHDLEHRARALRAVAVHVRREVLAAEELHGEPGCTRHGVDARGNDLDDVLAVDLRPDAGLLLEAGTEARIGDELRQHQLESPLFAGAQLLGDVDGAHAALAQEVQHAIVTREHRPRLQRGDAGRHWLPTSVSPLATTFNSDSAFALSSAPVLVLALSADLFNDVRGAIVDTSIGTAAVGDTLMAELGGEYAGIRSLRARRYLLQWDVFAALEAGYLANEHPFLFLMGPHALASVELDMRLFRRRRWSPYVGVGMGGEVSLLAPPGTAWSALDTLNSLDGIGGVVASGSGRASVGVSFLDRGRRSLLLFAFVEELFVAPETNTLGNTFTEIGVGARYDVARSVVATIEGVWGVSPSQPDALRGFTNRTTHVGAAATFRKIFPNGMWVGASASIEQNADEIVYSHATYDTGSPPTFRFTLFYGLPLWRKR